MLQEIVEHKREELQRRSPGKFFRSLKGKHNIIAELKFRSPSGFIADRKLPEVIKQYDKYAQAISVLTDKKYFGGDLSFIKEVKKYTKLPVLRKDFIIDPLQVYESAYHGADAILLIAAILTEQQLKNFRLLANKLGMDTLVEIHDEDDLQKIGDAPIVGINNRDLKTMKIDINRTIRLKDHITNRIIVSESGIRSKEDILKVDTNAVLIGTALMQGNIEDFHRTKLKVCGVHDICQGDMLGFNFCDCKRKIGILKAKELIRQMDLDQQSVGVFMEHTLEEIKEITETTNIDLIQIHDKDLEFCEEVSKATNRLIISTTKGTYAHLIDNDEPGTGKAYDRSILANKEGKIFAAGGITPTNLTEVLKYKPFAADIASGVETDGRKDPEKIRACLDQVLRLT